MGSGPGQEGEGQKYLCSHLNVNQVWLEQGSRDRGGRSKREPDRREEAEMGVVRGRGRGQRERARARQCWGHWEWGLGGSQRPHIQSNQRGHGEGWRFEGRKIGGQGLGARVQPFPHPLYRRED